MGQPTRLRELREAQGVTISQLAKKSKVTRETIYRVEAGSGQRTALQTLDKLAHALGVTLVELLGAA